MLWIRNITDYNEADIFTIFDHSFGYIQDIKLWLILRNPMSSPFHIKMLMKKGRYFLLKQTDESWISYMAQVFYFSLLECTIDDS